MAPGHVKLLDPAGAELEGDVIDERPDGSLTMRVRDGRRLFVPAHAVERRAGAEMHVDRSLADLALASEAARASPAAQSAADAEPSADAATAGQADVEERSVPIVAEEVVVEKRPRTAHVRVRTTTHEHDEEVRAVLSREHVEVRRVPVERYVDEPARIREEGDVTIVPLHEEVLVVEKRLLLREELHLTRREETHEETHRVGLRRQEAEIERTTPDERSRRGGG